jgi:hypothetical protein
MEKKMAVMDLAFSPGILHMVLQDTESRRMSCCFLLLSAVDEQIRFLVTKTACFALWFSWSFLKRSVV